MTLIIIIFITGYAAIAFESSIKLNKAASALITGALCWTIFFFQNDDKTIVNDALLHHLGDIASILFFLLGAMTIVELIDSHNGFDIISSKLRTRSKSRLLIMVAVVTFFLSALLDNLTTAIVMTSICSKLLREKNDRLYFAAIIILAANAGGAWSPLGDVTTTMLWIGGQVTGTNIIATLFLPSLFACFIPVAIVAMKFKGQTLPEPERSGKTAAEVREGKLMLIAGITLLLFVPAFKTFTHTPPFVGMLLALGLIWIFTTALRIKTRSDSPLSVSAALQRIDSPSILFFLGILLAVAALQSSGVLPQFSSWLNGQLQNDYLAATSLGLLSSVVDNVPLVAAAQGMYPLTDYPADHPFWEFLALTTGTGGSMLIIGSAAGVAVMGIAAIDFMWYLKKITWLALLGFAGGIAIFLLQRSI